MNFKCLCTHKFQRTPPEHLLYISMPALGTIENLLVFNSQIWLILNKNSFDCRQNSSERIRRRRFFFGSYRKMLLFKSMRPHNEATLSVWMEAYVSSTHTILPTNNKRLTTNDDNELDRRATHTNTTHAYTHTREKEVVSNRKSWKTHARHTHTHRERARQLVVSMPPLPTHMLLLWLLALSPRRSLSLFQHVFVYSRLCLSTHRLCCHMQSTEFARKSTTILRLLTNDVVGCTLAIHRAMLLNTKI